MGWGKKHCWIMAGLLAGLLSLPCAGQESANEKSSTGSSSSKAILSHARKNAKKQLLPFRAEIGYSIYDPSRIRFSAYSLLGKHLGSIEGAIQLGGSVTDLLSLPEIAKSSVIITIPISNDDFPRHNWRVRP